MSQGIINYYVNSSDTSDDIENTISGIITASGYDSVYCNIYFPVNQVYTDLTLVLDYSGIFNIYGGYSETYNGVTYFNKTGSGCNITSSLGAIYINNFIFKYTTSINQDYSLLNIVSVNSKVNNCIFYNIGSDIGVGSGDYHSCAISTSGSIECNNINIQSQTNQLTYGIFNNGLGKIYINDSIIKNTISSIYSKESDININNSHFFNFNTTLYSSNAIDISLKGCLIDDDSTNTVFNSNNSSIYIENCTIDGNKLSKDTNINTITCKNSIINYEITNNNIIFDSTGSAISESNEYAEEFKNHAFNDYRLSINSELVQFDWDGITDTNIEIDTNNFIIGAENFTLPSFNYLHLVYQNKYTLYFSNYENEEYFARILHNSIGLDQYSVSYRYKFSTDDILLKPTINASASYLPYDWDIKEISSLAIKNNQYIIPRSYINLKIYFNDIINNYGEININLLNKNDIEVYDKLNYTSIANDFNLKSFGKNFYWLTDDKLNLYKKDSYTNEDVIYPLFVKSFDKETIKPSGLIPLGWIDNKYSYSLSNDPNVKYLSDNANGEFYLFDTTLKNKNYKIHGMLAHKGKLFMTFESKNNCGILVYDNNRSIEYYITSTGASYTEEIPYFIKTPNVSNLSDITIYEDGTLLVGNYTNNEVYKFRICQDLLFIESSIDSNNRLIMKESYSQIEIE